MEEDASNVFFTMKKKKMKSKWDITIKSVEIKKSQNKANEEVFIYLNS